MAALGLSSISRWLDDLGAIKYRKVLFMCAAALGAGGSKDLGQGLDFDLVRCDDGWTAEKLRG